MRQDNLRVYAMEVRMDTKSLSPSTMWLLFAVVVVVWTAILLVLTGRS